MAGDSPLTAHGSRRGLVFFAHGSRDPLWRAPLDAVEARLRALHPDALCATAFLELCAPDLPTAVADMVAAGCDTLTVLPLFLGTGRHAREDLPRLVDALRLQHPQVQLAIATAVGEDPRVTDLLADIAADHLHKATRL